MEDDVTKDLEVVIEQRKEYLPQLKKNLVRRNIFIKLKGGKNMKIRRAEAIISFYKGLSLGEKAFLQSIAFSERTENANIANKKKEPSNKRKTRTLSGPIEHYDDEQIRYAWKLYNEGKSNKEIAEKTKIKEQSISKGYLTARLASMQKKIETN